MYSDTYASFKIADYATKQHKAYVVDMVKYHFCKNESQHVVLQIIFLENTEEINDRIQMKTELKQTFHDGRKNETKQVFENKTTKHHFLLETVYSYQHTKKILNFEVVKQLMLY